MYGLKIAKIIVDNKCRETDKIYSYLVPFNMNIDVGHRVIVPFGRGNRKIAGYVVGFADKIDFDKSKLKSILKLAELQPLIPVKIVDLVKWMRNKYLCFYIEAVHAVLPANVRIKTTYYYELIKDNAKEFQEQNYIESVVEVIEFIEANGGTASKEELRDRFNDNFLDNTLRKLTWLKIIKRRQAVKKTESKKYEKLIYINGNNIDNISIPANAKKQMQALDIIKNKPGISTTEIKKEYNISTVVIKNLLNKNAIKIKEKELYRLIQEEPKQKLVNTLTIDQLKIIDEINDRFNKGFHVLLHGVTGSGKTEVYLELIKKELSIGKQGIVLVPEISLTPQMIRRFVNRFGDTVAVLHSGLSDGEKYDEWRRIREGKAKVAVGARSAIFAPFNNLGIIIIDEEHEYTYKSELRPKYDAKEIAVKRCQLEGCKLLLGSATPSIETYYKAEKKLQNYSLVTLNKRINQKEMPNVKIVDMREELKCGNKSIFSKSLYNAIFEKLEAKEQIILFLNRRGYSTFVSCRNCGYVAKCPNCNISLTYHAKGNYLSCHYCGYYSNNPKYCPSCSSKHIKYFGIGTQKVEEEFKKRFGEINVLRMDSDTTTKKNSYKEILDKFRNKNADVLIGTQMIGKGHDFPLVTLVGIISSDTYLNMPDFKAAEKTFQMIIQAGGRAGRAKLTGNVIVQTYSPDHYSIKHAILHDYEGFFKDEIRLRKELNYPPFSHIGIIVISSFNRNLAEKNAKDAGNILRKYAKGIKDIEVWKPCEAPLSKIRNKFRWQIVLKSKEEEKLLEILRKFNKLNLDKTVFVSMDINPISML